jgi:hypothetical protein
MATVKSQIGTSGESVIRQDLADGTFRIRMDETNIPLCGYGNTRREAAKHLAEQLREQARLIEGIEGTSTKRQAKPARNARRA